MDYKGCYKFRGYIHTKTVDYKGKYLAIVK